jgi:transposase, IS30 family
VIIVHKSTVSRELKQNRGGRSYRPKQADAFAEHRQQAKVRHQIDGSTWAFVDRLICKEWSPEQISGWMKKNMKTSISHEWIYQYVLKNKLAGGSLYLHLHCKNVTFILLMRILLGKEEPMKTPMDSSANTSQKTGSLEP